MNRLPLPPLKVLIFSLLFALLAAQPVLAAVVRIDGIAAAPKNDFTPAVSRFGQPPFTASDPLISHTLNIADCKAISSVQYGANVRITFSWTDKSPLTFGTYTIKVAPPGASCDANSDTESVTANGCIVKPQDKNFSTLTAVGEEVDVDFKALLGTYAADAAGANCNANTEVDAKIYFVLPTTPGIGGTSSGYLGTFMNIHVDLAPPATPTISSVLAGNQNLVVNFAQADSTDTTVSGKVYWSDQPFTSPNASAQPSQSAVITGTSYQITGLQNGKTYYVSVTGVDANGNESQGSPVVSAVPVLTYDLWNKYQADGGTEQGGFSPCNAQPVGNAGVLALVLALGLLTILARRRRVTAKVAAENSGKGVAKKMLPLLLLTTAPLLFARQAHAVSPQTASAELRISSYKPGIDKPFGGTGPYSKIIGDGDFTFGATVDWRIWHAFGEIALGIGAGRWSHEGTALLQSGATSNDKTRLTIVPISFDAVYRLDVFSERYEFPVVPYAKLSVMYGIWWMRDGVENLSRYTNSSGKTITALGGTGGLSGTIGLRLLLDVFEPGAARSFDIEMGVNHSYLFMDYQQLWMNDFGSKNSINLSDGLLSFGLAFDL